MGCGCGYWARLLRERGVDVLAFDHKLPPKKERWTELKKGGPEVLAANSARALMLCYPDDFEDSEDSMALRCLRNYTGDTIVHIGEMLGETCCLPSPWGRTTDAEFQVSGQLPLLRLAPVGRAHFRVAGGRAQVQLATTFHKVLAVPLPSWPCSQDSLTVWKRTTTCIADGQMYAYVPAEDRLQLSAGVAAPSMAHLL